jgi:hypothetical protein
MAARGAESRACRGEAANVAAFCRRGGARRRGGDGGAARWRPGGEAATEAAASVRRVRECGQSERVRGESAAALCFLSTK